MIKNEQLICSFVDSIVGMITKYEPITLAVMFVSLGRDLTCDWLRSAAVWSWQVPSNSRSVEDGNHICCINCSTTVGSGTVNLRESWNLQFSLCVPV